MANPNRPGSTGSVGTTGKSPFPPIDREQLRQIQLLAEAVLVSFTATPSPLAPFGQSKLAWTITMPTTVIPGVHVEVHLSGDGDHVVVPTGSHLVAPHGSTLYALSLRTPLASRHLGTVDLPVDFGTCRLNPGFLGDFSAIVAGEARRSFPEGGEVSLRGDGPAVDIGYNSFVIDVPLTVDVNNWFDADVDVSLAFTVGTANRNGVRGPSVTFDFASTEVSFGAPSSIFSVGCSAFVAAALEKLSEGFLTGFIGPEVARRIQDGMQLDINAQLTVLNTGLPPARHYRLYELSLTVDGLNYRFCPPRSTPPGPIADPPDGVERSVARRKARRVK